MLSPPAIVAIVLMAFLFAGYREWLKFRSEGAGPLPTEVADTLQSLNDRLAELEQERDALADRVQNLETIVTSEAWIAHHDGTSSAGEMTAPPIDELLPPSDDTEQTSPAQRTAELARRLQSPDG